MDFTKEDYIKVASNFKLKDCHPTDVEPLGNGLTNTTLLVSTDTHRKYVLQKINTSYFPDVEKLMNNISYVAGFLLENGIISINLSRTNEGKLYYTYKGSYFRLYRYIANVVTYDNTNDLQIIESAGEYLAYFHTSLSKVSIDNITDEFKDYHNTPKRFENFVNAVKTGNKQRIEEAKEEIDFLMSFKDKIDVVENGLKKGYIPKRITHNDTKLNNYLFDPITNEAVCLIDFDTVMVSSALYDFGDATRSMCNIVGSSETDLNKVLFDLNIYEAFAKGYLKVGKKFLTKKEIELIPYSSFLITFELCTRFLADYLQNDISFPIKYEKHNLDRAKNQIQIVKDIICKMDKMTDIVAKYIK